MQGFPDNRARKAVSRTHNCGVEAAANWLMEHSGDADIDEPLELTVWLVLQNGRTAIDTESLALEMQWSGGEGRAKSFLSLHLEATQRSMQSL